MLARRRASAANEIRQLITAALRQAAAGTELAGHAGSSSQDMLASVAKVWAMSPPDRPCIGRTKPWYWHRTADHYQDGRGNAVESDTGRAACQRFGRPAGPGHGPIQAGTALNGTPTPALEACSRLSPPGACRMPGSSFARKCRANLPSRIVLTLPFAAASHAAGRRGKVKATAQVILAGIECGHDLARVMGNKGTAGIVAMGSAPQ